jgi:hypothetical protein
VFTLPLTPKGRTCSVRLALETTRVPADNPILHSSDTRALGVQVDYFRYLPPR